MSTIAIILEASCSAATAQVRIVEIQGGRLYIPESWIFIAKMPPRYGVELDAFGIRLVDWLSRRPEERPSKVMH